MNFTMIWTAPAVMALSLASFQAVAGKWKLIKLLPV